MLKRRKYLVKKNFQFRYIALVVIPLIVLLAALYYLIYYSVFREMLIPEAIVVTLLPAMKKVNIVIAFALPILLFSLMRTALIASNRVIGPIPRLEKELNNAIAEGRSIRMKVRQKDELGSFIDKINTLLEKVDKPQGA